VRERKYRRGKRKGATRFLKNMRRMILRNVEVKRLKAIKNIKRTPKRTPIGILINNPIPRKRRNNLNPQVRLSSPVSNQNPLHQMSQTMNNSYLTPQRTPTDSSFHL